MSFFLDTDEKIEKMSSAEQKESKTNKRKRSESIGQAKVAKVTKIPRLTLIPQFVSALEEKNLLGWIDKQPWSTTLSRRVQQYGFAYDYTNLNAVPASTTAIPAELTPLMDKLTAHMSRKPDQVIINEYMPGQGIAHHIDHVTHFGPVVCSVSLGSACVMEFKHKRTAEIKEIVLEPKSALVLTGEARYDWMHSIPKRRTDRVGTRKIQRTRRVSITFRLMKTA